MDILNIGYSNASERYFSTLAGVFFNFCDTFGPLDNQALANIPSNPSDQFLRCAGFSFVIHYLFQHLSSSYCIYGCGFCQAVHLNPVPVHCTRTSPYCSRHFRRSRRPFNRTSHYVVPHGFHAVQLMSVRSMCNLFHRILSISTNNAATLRLRTDLLYLLRINIHPNYHPARRRLLNNYLQR